MKATRELQFNQYEKTREYNTKHVNYTYSFLSAVSRVTNGDCTVSNRDSRVSQQANCTTIIHCSFNIYNNIYYNVKFKL
jgi:hypothetical protein